MDDYALRLQARRILGVIPGLGDLQGVKPSVGVGINRHSVTHRAVFNRFRRIINLLLCKSILAPLQADGEAVACILHMHLYLIHIVAVQHIAIPASAGLLSLLGLGHAVQIIGFPHAVRRIPCQIARPERDAVKACVVCIRAHLQALIRGRGGGGLVEHAFYILCGHRGIASSNAASIPLRTAKRLDGELKCICTLPVPSKQLLHNSNVGGTGRQIVRLVGYREVAACALCGTGLVAFLVFLEGVQNVTCGGAIICSNHDATRTRDQVLLHDTIVIGVPVRIVHGQIREGVGQVGASVLTEEGMIGAVHHNPACSLIGTHRGLFAGAISGANGCVGCTQQLHLGRRGGNALPHLGDSQAARDSVGQGNGSSGNRVTGFYFKLCFNRLGRLQRVVGNHAFVYGISDFCRAVKHRQVCVNHRQQRCTCRIGNGLDNRISRCVRIYLHLYAVGVELQVGLECLYGSSTQSGRIILIVPGLGDGQFAGDVGIGDGFAIGNGGIAVRHILRQARRRVCARISRCQVTIRNRLPPVVGVGTGFLATGNFYHDILRQVGVFQLPGVVCDLVVLRHHMLDGVAVDVSQHLFVHRLTVGPLISAPQFHGQGSRTVAKGIVIVLPDLGDGGAGGFRGVAVLNLVLAGGVGGDDLGGVAFGLIRLHYHIGDYLMVRRLDGQVLPGDGSGNGTVGSRFVDGDGFLQGVAAIQRIQRLHAIHEGNQFHLNIRPLAVPVVVVIPDLACRDRSGRHEGIGDGKAVSCIAGHSAGVTRDCFFFNLPVESLSGMVRRQVGPGDCEISACRILCDSLYSAVIDNLAAYNTIQVNNRIVAELGSGSLRLTCPYLGGGHGCDRRRILVGDGDGLNVSVAVKLHAAHFRVSRRVTVDCRLAYLVGNLRAFLVHRQVVPFGFLRRVNVRRDGLGGVGYRVGAGFFAYLVAAGQRETDNLAGAILVVTIVPDLLDFDAAFLWRVVVVNRNLGGAGALHKSRVLALVATVEGFAAAVNIVNNRLAVGGGRQLTVFLELKLPVARTFRDGDLSSGGLGIACAENLGLGAVDRLRHKRHHNALGAEAILVVVVVPHLLDGELAGFRSVLVGDGDGGRLGRILYKLDTCGFVVGLVARDSGFLDGVDNLLVAVGATLGVYRQISPGDHIAICRPDSPLVDLAYERSVGVEVDLGFLTKTSLILVIPGLGDLDGTCLRLVGILNREFARGVLGKGYTVCLIDCLRVAGHCGLVHCVGNLRAVVVKRKPREACIAPAGGVRRSRQSNFLGVDSRIAGNEYLRLLIAGLGGHSKCDSSRALAIAVVLILPILDELQLAGLHLVGISELNLCGVIIRHREACIISMSCSTGNIRLNRRGYKVIACDAYVVLLVYVHIGAVGNARDFPGVGLAVGAGGAIGNLERLGLRISRAVILDAGVAYADFEAAQQLGRDRIALFIHEDLGHGDLFGIRRILNGEDAAVCIISGILRIAHNQVVDLLETIFIRRFEHNALHFGNSPILSDNDLVFIAVGLVPGGRRLLRQGVGI